MRRDGKASYSDNLPEFYKFYVPALLSERLVIPFFFISSFSYTRDLIKLLLNSKNKLLLNSKKCFDDTRYVICLVP